ncbi:hypothetical protein HYFRA_00004832 [Hymenoscyphus fraxineus]|uniref:Uncharacterized protein n=1 Tax=Hymenoscyphus fraxineus TaxID=746836 RepID=A0A9N9KL05_9HELO|nr:hypothetical protein HYFRA_00004832 [Hymenoscyphus fraxineus]
MAPSKPSNPPSHPRKIPQRFKSMRLEIFAAMASRAQARQDQNRPEAGSVETAGELSAVPVRVLQGPPTEDTSAERSSKELSPLEFPSIVVPSAKAPRKRSRPSATQLARVPKLPKRNIQLRAALHAAARAKNASDGVSLNGEAVESEGVANRVLRPSSCFVDGDAEDKATNIEPDPDVNANQVQVESDVGPSQYAEDREDGGDKQLLREDTARQMIQKNPKHRSFFRVSKPRVQRRKEHRRQSVDELMVTAEKLSRATLTEDSSDEELPMLLHGTPKVKKNTRKPVNLHNIDTTEFRMPKSFDSTPSPSLKISCSDGFVGKEASPIGLVMRVRYPGQKKPRDRIKKSPLKMSELVIGSKRHQEERKRGKRGREIPSSSGQQYFEPHKEPPNDIVGPEDDPVMTASAITTDNEQDGLDVPNMPEEMLIDGDDHNPHITHNAGLDIDEDGHQLLTPSTMGYKSDDRNPLPTTELGFSRHNSVVQNEDAAADSVEKGTFMQSQASFESGLFLGGSEKVSKLGPSESLESDQTSKKAPRTPCREGATDHSDGEVDITEDEDSDRTESADGNDEVHEDEEMESTSGEDVCILSDTHTERTDTESESVSDYHTSDGCSLQSSELKSDRGDDLEEIVFDEDDLSDVASVITRPSQGSEMDIEGADQQDDLNTTDVRSTPGDEPQASCSNCFKSDEVVLDDFESVERPLSNILEMGLEDVVGCDHHDIAGARSDTGDEVEASQYYGLDFEMKAHDEQLFGKKAASFFETMDQDESIVVVTGAARALPMETPDNDDAEVMLLIEKQESIEGNSPSNGNPRLEILPSEIPDSNPQNQMPQLFQVSLRRNGVPEPLLPIPPDGAKETLSQQSCLQEQVWAPREPRPSTSMEIEGDEIVDCYSPPSSRSVSHTGISKHSNREHLEHPSTCVSGSSRGSRAISYRPRQAPRRSPTLTRTHSLTLVRSRSSPEPASESAMFSDQPHQVNSKVDAEPLRPQHNQLSSFHSEQTTCGYMSLRSVSASTDLISTSQQAEDEEILMGQPDCSSGQLPNSDVPSSQLTYVPEGSYMSRAQQELQDPFCLVPKPRSKSMFASSSRPESQQLGRESQASFAPTSPLASSVAPRQRSKRLPTLMESSGERGLKALTRRTSIAHGTTPNTGKRKSSATPRLLNVLNTQFSQSTHSSRTSQSLTENEGT